MNPFRYFVLFTDSDELLTAAIETSDPRTHGECETLLGAGWREVSKAWFDFIMEYGYEPINEEEMA